MSAKPHPVLKDSGVAWLGKLPAHWLVRPLKHVAEFQSGSTPDKSNREYWDGDVPWASAKDLKRFELFDTLDHITSRAIEAGAATLVGPGAVLIVVRGMILARTFPVAKVCVPMAINQDLKAVVARNGVKQDYLAWLLHGSTQETLSMLDEAGHGTKALRMDSWGSMSVPVPPADVQDAVSSFLEQETAKIDALVEEQKRLIELLKEKRQAVISQAVTKGLDPSVPMKDSGLECLGEVPTHWAVKRLKYVSPQVTVGIVVEPSKHYAEAGIPALRSLNVRPDSIESDGMVYITSEGDELHRKSRLSAGDLVAVRSGQPGTTAVIPASLDGCNCIDLLVIRRPAAGCSEFLCRFMNSDAARIQYAHGSGGAIQQHFNVESAGNLVLAWPPLQEQLVIAAAVAVKIKGFDELIDDATIGIELLAERRSSLISAAVTGKIDVRSTTSEVQHAMRQGEPEK